MQRSRRRPPMPDGQADLFLTSRSPTAVSVPGWNALPDRTRHAVTSLMTCLLLAHANGEASEPGSDADEY